MLKIENAFLLDICLGFPFGKSWFPAGLPEVKPEDVPNTFLLKGEQLATIKALVMRNDSSVERVVEGLRIRADSFLAMPNPSVVQKPSAPEGAERNDYCSLAKYWWPNPEVSDGKPYIIRDGEVNPECYSAMYDVNRLDSFSEASLLLSVAAFVTEDGTYAAKAVSLINTWIVDPETRQTPHFRFAQLIPGKDKARFQGLIEARRLIYVCEVLQLLRHIDAIPRDDFEECVKWYTELLQWIENSDQGQEARKQKNNIGFWTDLQRLIYARFCGQDDLADRIVRNSVLPRIDEQIDEDGKLSRELTRAKPYDYVAFTLLAMAGLSAATHRGEIQLAEYSTDEGRSFQNAFNWFTETTHANSLQEAGLALGQLADLQRQLTQLKAENTALEQEIKHSEEALNVSLQQRQDSVFTKLLSPGSTSGDAAFDSDELKAALQRVSSRLQTAEKESARLRSELNENYRILMSEAVRYRGFDFIIKEQADSLIRAETQLKESEVKLSQLRQEITSHKTELDSVNSKLKTEREKNKELAAKIKKRESELIEFKMSYQKTKKDLSQIQREYDAILQSTTWRYTLPIRKAMDLFKRVVGKSGKRQPKDSKKKVFDKTSNQAHITKSNHSSNSVDPIQLMRSVKPYDVEALKVEYVKKGLDGQPDNFVLYRIIGNDLYPRHKKGQSRENLQFVLENEPDLENCEKRWVVNRIIDKDEEKAIIELLRNHQQQFIHIPFHPKEYQAIDWDTDCLPEPGYLASEAFEALGPEQRDRVIGAIYRLKNNYVMHNNGARNAALREGKAVAKWVLPWDGNCFITLSAWEQIRADVTTSPYLKYFAVPMTRVVDNAQLLSGRFTPDPVEEPQLIFRMDSTEEFNEDFCYGRRPKVELFWRLGIPGKWDGWKDDPWDQKRSSLSPEARQFGVAGWVARMFSGMKTLEQDNMQSFKQRGIARLDAIITTLRYADAIVSGNSTGLESLSSFRADVLEEERRCYQAREDSSLTILVNQLIADAEKALTWGPYSVIDKTTLPPSGNANDYWHPAPYWWPNPDKPNGLPYIRRDGERVPGTRMYEPESDKYDRTRLQRVFDDSTILALAWKFTGKNKYAEHGSRILKRFFVDPATRMTPHLQYAQVRMGRNKNIGFSTGIIEMKDMYYYLDAVQLLKSAGVVSEDSLGRFKEWLSTYLQWLLESPQGKKERKATNNHGTYYDLQVAAIAFFLDERLVLFEALARAQSRIAQQFAPDGSQPEELNRTTTAHYCCFNFQGWINLAEIASRWGTDLWSYEAPNGAGLVKAAQWLLAHVGMDWPYQQVNEFDVERFFPIWFSLPTGSIELPETANFPDSKCEVKPKFFPHDGVRPYWNLGVNVRGEFNANGKKQQKALAEKTELTRLQDFEELIPKIGVNILRIAFPLVGRGGMRGNPDAAQPSGSTLSTLILAEGLKAIGIEPVILLHKDGATVDYIEKRGLKAVVVNVPFFDKRQKITDEKLDALFAAMPEIKRVLQGIDLTAIHTNDAHMHRTWGYVCEELRIPHVWHERGLFKHPEMSLRHLRAAEAIISVSDYVTKLAPADVQQCVNSIPDPITVPSDLTKDFDRKWLREILGVPSSAVVLVMVANENPRKRWEIFFEAGAKAAAQRSDLHFCTLGLRDQAYISTLIEKYWSTADAQGQFHCLGYRPDAPRIMSGSDVVVTTAINEPLGRTPVEGLLVHTPILAAASGGHIEVLSKVAPYCLVSPDTVDEFTKRFLAVNDLYRDYLPNRVMISTNLLAKFDPEAHVRQIASIYAHIYTNRKP